MTKLLLLIFLSAHSFSINAQNDFIVLKKRQKSVHYFYRNNYFSFQLNNKDWVKGIITKVENDSFYFTKEVVRYGLMGSDTMHFSGFHFALSDIYAVPKRGVQIDWVNDHYQIISWGGHQHFYWVKSGYIFRLGAGGYALVNVINGIVKHHVTLEGSKMGIAAAVFAGGVILKKVYTVTHRLGRKYKLVTVKVPPAAISSPAPAPLQLEQ